MAINYPGFVVPKGYDKPDIYGEFAKGYGLTKGIKDENEAAGLLKQYAASLYGGGSPAAPMSPMGQQQPSTPAAYADQLVGGSHSAAQDAADPMLTAYLANTRRAESGGDDSARNPSSTATGRYQFLEGTWNDLMQRHPDLGLTPDGRTDPMQQEKAIRVFTAENARALQGAGVPVNPGSLYAAHFLGAGGAPKVLTGDPSAPVSAYVDPAVMQANPQLEGMTVADFQQWANKQGGSASGGYQAPMMPQPAASPAGGGLPPRELMQQLLANPQTREFAQSLVTSAQSPQGKTADAADVQTYRMYRQEEMAAGRQPLNFVDFKRAISNKDGLAIQTNPDGSVSIVQGNTSGIKLTEGQGKDVGFYARGLDANTQLATMDETLTDWGQSKADLIPLGLGNYLRNPEFRKAKVAADSFLTAILRKDTGAAITPQEFDIYGPMFLPVPGDDAGTIQTKRRAREVALLAIRSGLGTAEAVAEANRIAMGIDDATPILDAGLPPDVTEDDIQETMKIHGLTREQVLERLNGGT